MKKFYLTRKQYDIYAANIFGNFPRDGKYIVQDYVVAYVKNGRFHRRKAPAIEWNSGVREWIVNGKYHRLDGPAFETPEGIKFWYMHGKCHRLDGPAVQYAHGGCEYYIDGIKIHKDNYESEVEKYKLKTYISKYNIEVIK